MKYYKNIIKLVPTQGSDKYSEEAWKPERFSKNLWAMPMTTSETKAIEPTDDFIQNFYKTRFKPVDAYSLRATNFPYFIGFAYSEQKTFKYYQTIAAFKNGKELLITHVVAFPKRTGSGLRPIKLFARTVFTTFITEQDRKNAMYASEKDFQAGEPYDTTKDAEYEKYNAIADYSEKQFEKDEQRRLALNRVKASVVEVERKNAIANQQDMDSDSS